MLAVFPAGQVAHLNLMERAVIDPEWSHNVARIVRLTKASVLPIYFQGANSALFQLLGWVHPKVRTALLAHEFLNKTNRPIEVRIGNPISPEKIRTYQDDLALTRYLRHRTYLLQNREAPPAGYRKTSRMPLASPVFAELIAAEIAKLDPERTLVDSGELSVLLAGAAEIPNALHEIGRLREVTFRQCGEGTGKSIDLDGFDDLYWHLFVWNRSRREIVGAYRLGPSREILDPLLLLWKRIGQCLAGNPEYKVLFGPVSISNEYTPAARQLMVMFLSTFRQSNDLAPLVRPRRPFRRKPSRLARELVGATVSDLEELSALIADVEMDRKGVPILLKQYLKLGGELVTFNVDRKFANALDGLIVVDLRKTDRRLLERYMGKEGAAAFANHGTAPEDHSYKQA